MDPVGRDGTGGIIGGNIAAVAVYVSLDAAWPLCSMMSEGIHYFTRHTAENRNLSPHNVFSLFRSSFTHLDGD